MRQVRRHLLFWLIALVGTFVDQATKILVGGPWPERAGFDDMERGLPRVFGILRHRNYGALGGMLSGYPVILVIISVVAMGIILWLFISAKPHRHLVDLSLALMMAGAVANLIDRLAFGYVRDFIKVLFVNWPIFNVADAWLTIGVGCMFLALAFSRKSHAAETKAKSGRG